MQSSFPLLAAAASLTLFPCLGTFAQQYNPAVDIQQYRYELTLSDSSDLITGHADIGLVCRTDTRSLQLDLTAKNTEGKGMTVTAVKKDGNAVSWSQDKDRLLIPGVCRTGEKHTYSIDYNGIPADGLIIASNKYGHRGFFGDNWPNRAHNWLPCIDHPSDKASVEFAITAPDHFTVVANGALQEERALPGHRKLTRWKEPAPISPKIMVIGVADFAVDHPGDTLNVPVWNYVYKEDKMIGFHSYAYALQILPFYIGHIGPYPFAKCGNVQSKTRFGGLENAGAIFYFENSVQSPGIESLMAHEIAHQWFGDAATETEWKHLWLSEGFATYMTHCYLESRYGADSLRKGMIKDRNQVISFEKKRLTAIVDTSVHEDYMQLLNPNSYEKGGWVLHMLRRRLGDSTFWKGIAAYYAAFRDRNASSADFEKTMESVSGQDLRIFFRQWLDRPGHPRLHLSWKKENDGKSISLLVDQLQTELYDCTLELLIDGTRYSMPVSNRNNSLRLQRSTLPETLGIDPDCNLLAEYIQ